MTARDLLPLLMDLYDLDRELLVGGRKITGVVEGDRHDPSACHELITDMKHFLISAHIDGFYIMEDPKCPSYWRGSGVYDIERPSWFEVRCDVWAVSEEQAQEMVLSYNYGDDPRNPLCMVVDVANIKSVEFLGEEPCDAPLIEVDYTAEAETPISDEELREEALLDKFERSKGN